METKINNAEVADNSEIATLFEKLEQYSKDKPEVFAFFCKKFEPVLYDNFDLNYALFGHFSAGADLITRIFPYIAIGLMSFNMLLTIVILATKK